MPRAALTAIVEAAALAPSGDNCQPARFTWDGESLRILFLRERAESFYDLHCLASWISLGAVIANVRLAAARLGFAAIVDVFPPHDPSGAVARVRFDAASARSEPLADAIPHRCVNRRPYRREPLSPAVHDEMAALAAAAPGVRLSWIDRDPARRQIAAVAAHNDRILFENRELHEGVFRWIRWTPREAERRRDGMPVETLELSAFEKPGIRLLSSWRWARRAAALRIVRALPYRAREIYRRSGAIALLSVPGEEPADFVRAGEVLERIWLTATSHGIAFQPITGITFLILRLRLTGGDKLSSQHRALLAKLDAAFQGIFPEAAMESPVMLFRLGLAPPPSARSPRLPLDQIFETTGG